MLFVNQDWRTKSKKLFLPNPLHLVFRTFPFRKDTLVRKFEKIETIYGEVTVKTFIL